VEGLQQQRKTGAAAAPKQLDHTPYLAGFVGGDREVLWPQGEEAPHCGGLFEQQKPLC
jgi:hypothetical protein